MMGMIQHGQAELTKLVGRTITGAEIDMDKAGWNMVVYLTFSDGSRAEICGFDSSSRAFLEISVADPSQIRDVR